MRSLPFITLLPVFLVIQGLNSPLFAMPEQQESSTEQEITRPDDAEVQCSICCEPIDADTIYVYRACGHFNCLQCINDAKINRRNWLNKCPLCQRIAPLFDPRLPNSDNKVHHLHREPNTQEMAWLNNVFPQGNTRNQTISLAPGKAAQVGIQRLNNNTRRWEVEEKTVSYPDTIARDCRCCSSPHWIAKGKPIIRLTCGHLACIDVLPQLNPAKGTVECPQCPKKGSNASRSGILPCLSNEDQFNYLNRPPSNEESALIASLRDKHDISFIETHQSIPAQEDFQQQACCICSKGLDEEHVVLRSECNHAFCLSCVAGKIRNSDLFKKALHCPDENCSCSDVAFYDPRIGESLSCHHKMGLMTEQQCIDYETVFTYKARKSTLQHYPETLSRTCCLCAPIVAKHTDTFKVPLVCGHTSQIAPCYGGVRDSYYCTECRSEMACARQQVPLGSPLLRFTCGHSACLASLRLHAKQGKPLSCPACKKTVSIINPRHNNGLLYLQRTPSAQEAVHLDDIEGKVGYVPQQRHTYSSNTLGLYKAIAGGLLLGYLIGQEQYLMPCDEPHMSRILYPLAGYLFMQAEEQSAQSRLDKDSEPHNDSRKSWLGALSVLGGIALHTCMHYNQHATAYEPYYTH